MAEPIPTPQQLFWNALAGDDISLIIELLDHPDVDINAPVAGIITPFVFTAMHTPAFIWLIVTHRKFDVNVLPMSKDLISLCLALNLPCFSVLLDHRGINDDYLRYALCAVIISPIKEQHRYVEQIFARLPLGEPFFENGRPAHMPGITKQTWRLLCRMYEHRDQTIVACRLAIGRCRGLYYFTLAVMVSDGYIRVARDDVVKSQRFLGIVSRLPQELQRLICEAVDDAPIMSAEVGHCADCIFESFGAARKSWRPCTIF